MNPSCKSCDGSKKICVGVYPKEKEDWVMNDIPCPSCSPIDKELGGGEGKCCDKQFVWSGDEGTSHHCCNVHCCKPSESKAVVIDRELAGYLEKEAPSPSGDWEAAMFAELQPILRQPTVTNAEWVISFLRSEIEKARLDQWEKNMKAIKQLEQAMLEASGISIYPEGSESPYVRYLRSAKPDMK